MLRNDAPSKPEPLNRKTQVCELHMRRCIGPCSVWQRKTGTTLKRKSYQGNFTLQQDQHKISRYSDRAKWNQNKRTQHGSATLPGQPTQHRSACHEQIYCQPDRAAASLPCIVGLELLRNGFDGEVWELLSCALRCSAADAACAIEMFCGDVGPSSSKSSRMS